jgi:hypothetical protein
MGYMVESKILKASSGWKEDYQRLQLLMEIVMNWFEEGRVMTVHDFDGLMLEAQREADE